jgi:tetratricopeptide (TPR) repeat protein
MKIFLVALICMFILVASAAGQQRFEPTPASRRQATVNGRAREYVAAMEALGPAAAAQGSWDTASLAYTQAAAAAIQLGQLQKAIALAVKASEMAEKGDHSYLQGIALLTLADTYGRLGQPQKEKEWLDQTVAVARRMKGDNRDIMEARLSQQLGEYHLRQGDLNAAIEHLSNAVTQWDARLKILRSPARAKNKNFRGTVQFAVEQLSLCLHRLGTAHLKNANPKDAEKVLERGIANLTNAGLESTMESSLYMSLGQAYLAEKDFPRALETLTKGLQLAEARGQTLQLQTTSAAIGNIFLQSNRHAEAIPFYKKAVDAVESTRSLLESEELRTSFFQNKGQVYAGIILSQLGAKNLEEAFNYNERARSRAFLDILGSKVQLGRQSALVEEEKTILSRIAELRSRSAGPGGGDDEAAGENNPAALRKELESAEKAYGDFLSKVRKENKEQASLMNVEPLKLRQLQESLDPGVTVLEYFVLSGRAALWIVSKDQVNFARLSLNRSELVSKVSALRESINQLEDGVKFKQVSEEL